jgi:hypothetical protein
MIERCQHETESTFQVRKHKRREEGGQFPVQRHRDNRTDRCVSILYRRALGEKLPLSNDKIQAFQAYVAGGKYSKSNNATISTRSIYHRRHTCEEGWRTYRNPLPFYAAAISLAGDSSIPSSHFPIQHHPNKIPPTNIQDKDIMVAKLFRIVCKPKNRQRRLETTPVKVIQSISTDESTQADSAAKSVLDDLLQKGYNPKNGGDLILMESRSDDSSDRYALTGSVDEQEQRDLPNDLSRDSSYYMGASERETTVGQEDMSVWSEPKQHIEIMVERSDDRVRTKLCIPRLAKASRQEPELAKPRSRTNLHVKPNIFKTGTDENHIISPASPSSMVSFFQRLKPTSPTNNDRADPPGTFLDKYSLIDETESCEASLKKIQIHAKQQGDISVISMDAAITTKLRWGEDDGAVDSEASLSIASETKTGSYTTSSSGSSNSSESDASSSTKSPSVKYLEKTSCDSQDSSSKKGHSESSVVWTDKESKGSNTMWDWNHAPFSSTFLSKEVNAQTSMNGLGATTSAVTASPVGILEETASKDHSTKIDTIDAMGEKSFENAPGSMGEHSVSVKPVKVGPVDAPSSKSSSTVKQPLSLSNQEMPLSGARHEKPSISKDTFVQTENNDKRSASTGSKSSSRLRKGLKSLFRRKKDNCVEGVIGEEPLPSMVQPLSSGNSLESFELPIDVSSSNSEERMTEELYADELLGFYRFMPIALMSFLKPENDPSFDCTSESTTEQSCSGKSILSESTKGAIQSKKINFVELSPSFIGDIKTDKGEKKQKKRGGLMKRFKGRGKDCTHFQEEIPRNTYIEVPRMKQQEIDEMAETEILEKVEEGVELIAGLTKCGKKAIVISNTRRHPQRLYEC